MTLRSSAYLLCLLSSFSLAATSYAPFYADWKVRYEPSPQTAPGPAPAMALDANGDAIVIGHVAGAGGGGGGVGIPPDLFASIDEAAILPPFVNEATGKVFKYDHDDGSLVWSFNSNSSIAAWSTQHYVVPRAVAIASDGSIFVAGQVTYLEMVMPGDPGNTPDIFLIKLNSSGALQGYNQVVRSYGQDVTGMVINGSNVYVSGNEATATGNRAFAAKFSTSLGGPTFWTASTGTRANAIDINSAGDCLVVAGENNATSTDMALWRVTPSTMATHTSYTWDGFGLTDSATSVDMADSASRCVIGGRSDKFNGSSNEGNGVMIRLNLNASSITINGVASKVAYETIATHSNPGDGVVKVVYDDTDAYAVGTYSMVPFVYKANFSSGSPAWYFLSTALGLGSDITMNNGKIFALGEGQPSFPHLGYEFMAFGSGSGTPVVNTFVYDDVSTEQPATPTDLAVYRVPNTTNYRLFGTGGWTGRWFTTAKQVSVP